MRRFDAALKAARRASRIDRLNGALLGALASAAGVALLVLSGWFITACALAGATGAALAFNYLLPSAGVRAFAILRTGARYGERLVGHGAALAVMAHLKPVMFAALAQGAPETASAFSSGAAASALAEDCSAIEAGEIDRTVFLGGLVGAGVGLALACLGGSAAFFTLFGAMLAFAAAFAAATRYDSEAERAALDAAAALKRDAAAWVDAAAEASCYQGIDRARWALERRADDLNRAQTRRLRARVYSQALTHVFTAFAAGATLYAARATGAPLAAASAFGALTAIEALAAALRMLESGNAMAAARARLAQLLLPPRVQGDASTTLALNGSALPLHAGDRILITGASGAGKTTALKRLIGLSGGYALAPQRFAYAPQDAQAVSGTLRDNLLLARPDAEDADLWLALHIACLDERVRAMPHQLDAWVGDGGARLSGGERRRLAIARALVASSDWLVLDEPSEGLDAVTEAQLIARLDAHLKASGQGLIVVTHRDAWARLHWDTRAQVAAGDFPPARAAA